MESQVLEAFTDIARDATAVNSPESLDTLLRTVGRRLCELIGVRRCSVYLGTGPGEFQGRVGYYVLDDIDAGVKLLVSGSDRFTEEIVATRAPVLITDAQHDPRTVQSTMQRWGVRDMLGVPLVMDTEVIGIIYLDDRETEHVYTDRQISLAQTFANLAALSVRQAALLAEVSQRAAVIEAQRRELAQATAAHERLTDAVLSGLTLVDIVRVLADLLSRPVLVYNLNQVLMTSSARGGDRHNTALQGAARGTGKAELVAALRASGETGPSVVLAPAPALGCPHRRMICPMVIEGRTAGYLVTLETGGRFSALDTRIAQHGATVVTLAMFHELRQSAARDQARQEFLGDLLHGGRDPGTIARRAQVHGIDLALPHVLVRIAEAAAPEQRGGLAAALAGELGLADVLTTAVPGAAVLLVATPAEKEIAAARAVRDAVVRVLPAQFGSAPPTVVISSVCRELGDYPRAAVEVRRVMDLLARIGRRGQVELAGELAVSRLIASSVPSAQALDVARQLVGPILELDRVGHAELLPTLRALLAEDGQVRGTARLLGVHENTVRYRMAKVRDCSAIDPHRLDSLLDLRYCLQILDLAGELVGDVDNRSQDVVAPPG
ncbi:GAF domain-containing protein [Sporichthya sp.]|uniref:helix-turn-helix domain-containing protein n=1 Tax=Sporichthya sp. TaxID=65475 RepID=UPI0018419F57|nr:GAF domain-containing protein [Sporichthya sp.]MBA3741702.1 GAF domain-containing protein [Sporichthya sp.]